MYRDILPPIKKVEEEQKMKKYQDALGLLLMTFGTLLFLFVAFAPKMYH